MAARFGQPQEEIKEWLNRSERALPTLWHESERFFYPRDLVSGELIRLPTWEGLIPLYAGTASAAQAEHLTRRLEDWSERVRYLAPSLEPDHPTFERRRYWRGPVWMNVNWLLAQGLADYGFADLAARLEADSRELVHKSGMREYFNPHTGEELGGSDFAWTAALYLAWLAGPAGASEQKVAV